MILAKEKINQLPQETPRVRQKKRVRRVTKTRLNAKAVYTGVFAIAFIVGIVFTNRYAQLAVTGYNVDQLKNKLANLELANQRLNMEVDKLKSLDRIEKVAMGDLGMVQPEGVQFIAVEGNGVKNNLPGSQQKSSAVAETKSVKKVASADGATNFFNGVFRLVFGTQETSKAEATTGD